MTSCTLLAGIDIPDGVANPYIFAAHRLQEQMYPTFTTGFSVRIACIIGLLSFLICVSIGYIVLQVRESGGSSLAEKGWIARVVKRPEGRYFVLNQHILYPICSIAMAGVWIAYCIAVYRMFDKRANPDQLYFWISTMWIPFYLHVATTTFSVVAGANLASKSTSSESHWTGPWMHNGLAIVLIPCVILAMLGTGIWTSYGWRDFGRSWVTAHDALLAEARAYNGMRNATLDAHLLSLTQMREAAFCEFVSREKMCTILYASSAALVIIVNIMGGLSLLSKLRHTGTRQVGLRNDHVVAPLEMYPRTRGDEEDPQAVIITLSGEIPVAGLDLNSGSAAGRDLVTAHGTRRLRKVEWDVTIFFFAVIPACLAFIGFSIWKCLSFVAILRDGRLVEFACLGMVWIYAGLAAGSMSAICIKKLLANPESSKPPVEPEDSLVIENNLRRMYKKSASEDSAWQSE